MAIMFQNYGLSPSSHDITSKPRPAAFAGATKHAHHKTVSRLPVAVEWRSR